MTWKEFGQRVRDLIAKGWCKEHYAEDGQGNVVSYASDCAKCFCLDGAIFCTGLDPAASHGLVDRFRCGIRQVIGCPTIGLWNDVPERTQSDVLAAIDQVLSLPE